MSPLAIGVTIAGRTSGRSASLTLGRRAGYSAAAICSGLPTTGQTEDIVSGRALQQEASTLIVMEAADEVSAGAKMASWHPMNG